jgi:NADPH:quinone reductase-like Zn-dependent oxidoreductase
MKTIASPSYGPLAQLTLTELPLPEPRQGEVRVKVAATAVNPADYKSLLGTLKFLHGRQFPMVVGYDFAGTIDAVGAEVRGFIQGDPVFGFLAYGGSTKQGTFAEFVVTPITQLTRLPKDLSPAVAAACATPGVTALQALRDEGRLPQGGRVLIIGASGGVGSVAIGVARKLGAASVTAVCSTHAVDFVRDLGADEIIDRKKEDPLKVAKGPFDVVFDAAAAHSWTQARHLVKPGGAYVTTLPSLTFAIDKVKSLFASQRCGVVFVKSLSSDLEIIGKWVAEGMKVPIATTLPVRDVRQGIEKMMSGEMKGRIAIDVAGGF